MRYLTSISLALILLMALACTATPTPLPTPAPTPLPTPDVPLLDAYTVDGLVRSYIVAQRHITGDSHPCHISVKTYDQFRDSMMEHLALYVGNDIWVVRFPYALDKEGSSCTFTVHDKEAHVILPK